MCSSDLVESHARFAEKYALPFILCADPERTAIEAYGVWREKTNFGKTTMGVVRSTFVIDPDGVVARIFPRAKPDTNAQQIVDFLSKAG